MTAATTAAFACPACGFAQHPANSKCLRCGVPLAAATPGTEADADAPVPHPPLSSAARRALAIGFVLALIFIKLPFMGILFHPLITILHELGHTIAGWMFGYPAIPAFDFAEGGGVTTMEENQSILGALVMYAIFGTLIWRARRHPPTIVGIVVCIALYSFLFFTHWHKAVILVAGHGAELVFASIFLNRAMTGTSLLQADERPAYAMVGFFMLFYDVGFFWKLANDAAFRDWYDAGKSYADNDLVVLLDEHWRSSLPHVANLFLIGCVASVVLARLAYRYEGAIGMWASTAFATKVD